MLSLTMQEFLEEGKRVTSDDYYSAMKRSGRILILLKGWKLANFAKNRSSFFRRRITIVLWKFILRRR